MSFNGWCSKPSRARSVVGVTPGFHVVVVDRYLTFADTLATGLRSQRDVLGAVALTSTESLWQILHSSLVDVVILDSELLMAGGHPIIQRILEEYPATRVVVLSSEADPASVVEALTSGAAGWLPKNLPLQELLHGLRAVVSGETWVPARLLTAVLKAMTAAQAADASVSSLRPLTTREHQILQCLVDGMSRPQIAERLGMSPNTVRTHVHNVLHKLGAHSSLRAVAIAREVGLATNTAAAPPQVSTQPEG